MGTLVNGLGASGPGGLEPIIHSIADCERLSLKPLLRSVSLWCRCLSGRSSPLSRANRFTRPEFIIFCGTSPVGTVPAVRQAILNLLFHVRSVSTRQRRHDAQRTATTGGQTWSYREIQTAYTRKRPEFVWWNVVRNGHGADSSWVFDVLLTVHLVTVFVSNQLDTQFFFFKR